MASVPVFCPTRPPVTLVPFTVVAAKEFSMVLFSAILPTSPPASLPVIMYR